jgi:Carboxypeptidase regulatory-like domain
MPPKLHGPVRPAQAARRVGAAAACVAAALVLGCSHARSHRSSRRAPRALATVAVVPLVTMAAIDRYRVQPPISRGRVTGSIKFDGPAPTDSIVHPQTDADVCGQTLVDPTVEHRGPLLANAVIWLDGVTAGKGLPIVRRYDITNEGCRLVPRVQAAIKGGTLDVRNADQTAHKTRFIQAGTRAVLATVLETEAGAVVPSRAVLAVPGLVEVRCDGHPWTRGWIVVFDQPYFTTTNTNGGFTIDSVPPGRYRLSVWHERFGTQSDSVTVVAGHDAVVDITFKGQTVGD